MVCHTKGFWMCRHTVPKTLVSSALGVGRQCLGQLKPLGWPSNSDHVLEVLLDRPALYVGYDIKLLEKHWPGALLAIIFPIIFFLSSVPLCVKLSEPSV